MLDEAKKALIIELRQQDRTYKEIMQIAKVSPRDISAALKEEMLKDGQMSQEKAAKVSNHEGQTAEKLSTRIYKLLLERKNLLDITLELNIDEKSSHKWCSGIKSAIIHLRSTSLIWRSFLILHRENEHGLDRRAVVSHLTAHPRAAPAA